MYSGAKHGSDLHLNSIWILVDETAEGTTAYVNKAINTALGKEIEGVGRLQPDVLTIAKDGSINIKEILSPRQSLKQMEVKVRKMESALKNAGYTVNSQIYTTAGELAK